MANVANLRINAIVNDQATPALRRINGALNGLNSGMSGASGGALGAARALTGVGGGANLAAVGLGVAAAATAAVVAGTVALVKASVDAAAKTEGYRNTLIRLTGDASKADDILSKLQEFADWSPFDDDAVMQSAQRLLGAGVAADDLTKVMTALSDVSGDSAETFQRASVAFSQMALKGKVSQEELNQFAEAGIPAQKLLADAMGVTSGALGEMIQKGLVPANKALPLLIDAIGKKFGGATERASQSTKGLKSTLSAGLERTFEKLGKAIEPLTKYVLTDLIAMLKDVQLGILVFTSTQEFQDFLVGAKEAWTGFAAVIRAVLPLLFDIGRVLMMIIGPALSLFGKYLQGVAYVIQKVVQFLKPFWDILRAIGQQIKAVIEWLAPWVARIQQVIKAAALAVEGFIEWIKSGGLLQAALALVQAVIEAITKAIEWLWDRINKVIQWFKDWITNSEWVQKTLGFLEGAIDKVREALEKLGVIKAQPTVEIDDQTRPAIDDIQFRIDNIKRDPIPVGIDDQTRPAIENIQFHLDDIKRDPIPVGVVDIGEQARIDIQTAVDSMTGGNIPIGVTDTGAEERQRIQDAINAMQGRTGANAIVIETVNRTINQVVTQSGSVASTTTSSSTSTFAPATGDPYNEAAPQVKIPGGVNVTPLDQPQITPQVVQTIVPATNNLITSITNALGRWKNADITGSGAVGNFAMADGGIVTRATRALIGEAGPEAVIPLSQLGDMMGAGMHVTINVSGYADGAGAGRAAADAFRRQLGLQRRLPFGTA